MIAVQLDMFDLMVRAAEIWPVKPNGPVAEGTPDHTLRLRHPKFAWDIATIEVHRCRETGKWMWSTAFHIHHSGSGYKVGPKWGKFASSASDALHWAKVELCQGIHNRASAEENLKIKAWAEQIALEPPLPTGRNNRILPVGQTKQSKSKGGLNGRSHHGNHQPQWLC